MASVSRPSLDHLHTFVTVFRAGSVTKASDLLGISQSTASAHLQALEASLGYAVLERGRGGVTLTAKGAELAREVAPHIDALEDTALISQVTDVAPRAIHIGGAAEILSIKVVPHIGEVIASANVPIRLVFGLADDLLDALEDRTLDLVVSAVPPRRKGITATPIYDEEFVLVAAPVWSETTVDAVPLVAYAENLPIIRRYWRSVFDRAPDGLRTAAVIPDLRGIRTAVLAGVGMSVLPRYLVDDDLASGALITLDIPEVAPLNTLFLASRARELSSNATLGTVAATLRRLITS